ncbi:MAG TPA: DUF2851 family protein [Dysgonamonadaceae bacterium]|nr:DUF2851 family protein [Dysgonamonadaceae bacterium]
MIDKEELLQYIWKYKLYPHENLHTTEGVPVEVIDPGISNSDAGPDFFNAKIKIGNKLWAGNVEIHRASNEWIKHRHHTDKAYNSVILHVVENVNEEIYNEKGQKISQLCISVSQKIRDNADFLLFSNVNVPCHHSLHDISNKQMRSWLDALAVERLERKTNDIFRHLERFNNSWDETFYVLLSRNFGFGLNSEEFERLALSLPYNYILKHADNLFQVEALFFGQAGMLKEETITDDYYILLQKEYDFLRKKFSLKSLDNVLFKSLRTRPQGFPQLRIAELAAVVQHTGRVFSAILEIDDYEQLRTLFRVNASEYWQTHYTFGKESEKIPKHLGANSLDIILINTVVPLLFAYGKKNDIEKYSDRAIQILESVKPEKNKIIQDFESAGIIPENAFDTQALIQLRKEYCDQRKCLFCRIGHAILSQ